MILLSVLKDLLGLSVKSLHEKVINITLKYLSFTEYSKTEDAKDAHRIS